jgi:predicted nucleotidyltransferase
VTEQITRPATLEDLKTLLRSLNANSVDYLLIGGYALAAHGYQRATTDIDSQTLDLDGIPVRTVNLEGLLLTKQTMRGKDASDRIVIERALAVARQQTPDIGGSVIAAVPRSTSGPAAKDADCPL